MRDEKQDNKELKSLTEDIKLAKSHYRLACEEYVKNYCPIKQLDLIKIQDENYYNDGVGKTMVVERIGLIDNNKQFWHIVGCILKKDNSFVRDSKRYSVRCKIGNEEAWLLNETYAERMKKRN